MNMKAKYLRVASIFSYVFTFVYAVITALFFSVREPIYVMFLIFGLVSLCLGLYTESIIYRTEKENQLTKVDRIVLIVITVLSVIDCLALLFKKAKPLK